MLAPTPPMGWNSWNTFGSNIHENLVRETADVFITQGLKDAGYTYIVIDDMWQADERDADGRLVPDPAKFPSGIKTLADYIHSKGLKFGIYSCAGAKTCAGKPGSFGYEELDARTFAAWGVDYLKYDFCYKPANTDGPALYRRMGQALRATGRPIVFSACEWGLGKPWEWAAGAGAHLWRTTGDIEDSWESIAKIGFGQAGLEAYSGPDQWNDPDMLVVGMYGKGNVARGGCTDAEYRTHFSLWCLLAAPLLIGCDVRQLDAMTRTILLNRNLIAVNQDGLGRQARYLGRDWDCFETWMKPLADGSVAVGQFNRHDTVTRAMSAAWEALAIHDRQPCRVQDLWSGEDLGAHERLVSVVVEPHDARVLRITPVR
ncbi:MAG TPA: glycoside hydrolase family 27 protein [Phototrophicaceae bacterium]|nr:glycoside hydrolase family 27 protein [Phototrophicaceae bacterium]